MRNVLTEPTDTRTAAPRSATAEPVVTRCYELFGWLAADCGEGRPRLATRRPAEIGEQGALVRGRKDDGEAGVGGYYGAVERHRARATCSDDSCALTDLVCAGGTAVVVETTRIEARLVGTRCVRKLARRGRDLDRA
jgi:hypothetical protein